MWDEEFFRQLTAEQLTEKTVRGYRKFVWEKTRERNEALDTRVYARACLTMLGGDRWDDRRWREERQNGITDQVEIKKARDIVDVDDPKAPRPVPIAADTIKRRRTVP